MMPLAKNMVTITSGFGQNKKDGTQSKSSSNERKYGGWLYQYSLKEASGETFGVRFADDGDSSSNAPLETRGEVDAGNVRLVNAPEGRFLNQRRENNRTGSECGAGTVG
jgi:hypothetical protein